MFTTTKANARLYKEAIEDLMKVDSCPRLSIAQDLAASALSKLLVIAMSDGAIADLVSGATDPKKLN